MGLETICSLGYWYLHFTMGLARGLGADQCCETGFHHHHCEMSK